MTSFLLKHQSIYPYLSQLIFSLLALFEQTPLLLAYMRNKPKEEL